MKISVKSVAQTSVISEKESYYLIIGEGEKKVVINIGKKTYDGVNELLMEPKPETNESKQMDNKKPVR